MNRPFNPQRIRVLDPPVTISKKSIYESDLWPKDFSTKWLLPIASREVIINEIFLGVESRAKLTGFDKLDSIYDLTAQQWINNYLNVKVFR